jgi:hypothetical protein
VPKTPSKRGPGRPKNSVIAEFPDHDTGDGLTARQRTILSAIRESVETRGYPPSMREIGDASGLQSTSSVSHQLTVLEQKGYIRRDPNRPRAMDVRSPEEHEAQRLHPVGDDALQAGSPPAGRSWPNKSSRMCFRSPAPWSARAPSTCSRCRVTRWSKPRSPTVTGLSFDSNPMPTTERSWPP